jgi:hypothetical protein
MISRPYDVGFIPPAPVTEVQIQNPLTEESAMAVGKLDSGPDSCVIPLPYVDRLGLSPKGIRESSSYDGTRKEHLIYYVDVRIGDVLIRNVRCIATNRSSVLLGRNVLNLFLVTLDGPALHLSIERLRQ